jgi:hypothetical protein
MNEDNTKKAVGTFAKLMSASKRQEKQEEVLPVQEKLKDPSAAICNITCNITLLQSDIDALRRDTNTVQTYRIHKSDAEFVRYTAQEFSKELSAGKVSQADILRVSLQLFGKMLEEKREGIKTLLEKIK